MVLSYDSGSSGERLFEKVFKYLVFIGRYTFFLSYSHVQNVTLNSTTNLYSSENIAIGSSTIVLTIIHYWVESILVSVMCGALPLTFWWATKKFEHFVSSNRESLGDRGDKNILGKFKELKLITRLINSIWAGLVINCFTEYALWITWLHLSIQVGIKVWIVHQCFFVAFLVAGVIIMAEGCRIVRFT